MQFYTIEHTSSDELGKDGRPIKDCSWFCFEPQYAPDTPNHSNFISNIFKPGEKYHHNIVYKFENI